MRLDRFTAQAREIFKDAQQIMHEEHHIQLDVEHLFLALLRQRSCALDMLQQLGVNVEVLAQALQRELDRAPKIYAQYPAFQQILVTPRTQRMAKRAEQIADQLGDQHIGPEHLLLAIASEGEGPAAKLLQARGADHQQLRDVLPLVRGGQHGEAAQIHARMGLEAIDVNLDELPQVIGVGLLALGEILAEHPRVRVDDYLTTARYLELVANALRRKAAEARSQS